MDFVSAFEKAMESAGIPASQPIIGDGQFRRYHVHGDSKTRKNGYYRLTIEGDLAFGAFGCNKRQINEKWFSKSQREYTPADRAKMDARREQIKADEAKMQAEAQRKAQWIWGKSIVPAAHGYADRKGIKLRKVREYRGKLVVPMYYCPPGGKPQIVGLQFIGADGDKFFMKGQRQKGCYTTINEPGDSLETMWICEGYATGASIYAATGQPVVIAFNAGNLVAVTEYIRGKYPQAALMIAADNDQWTRRPNGEPWNPGIEAATDAAERFGGRMVFPPFRKDDPRRPTDFNDLHLIAGIDELRDALIGNDVDIPMPAPERAPQESEAPPVDGRQPEPENKPLASDKADPGLNLPIMANWKQQLIMGKVAADGFPHPYDAKSRMNAYLFMKYGAAMKDSFTYNEFSDEVLIVRCPLWEDERDFYPRAMRREDFFMMSAFLEREQMKVGPEITESAAIKIAMENRINPPRDYFASLQWDGEKRLDKWLSYYCGAEKQPQEYLRMVGSKWLIGAVSRVFEPGCKFDSMLILEGEQDLGKSTVFRILATFNGQDYFLDSVGDIRNKDTLMSMQGKIIIEMAELASFKKTENEEIKGFISRQVDEYRPPYGRHVQKRPRYFVLGGTVNPEGEDGYLTDTTGNRRYWPVFCGSIDLEALTRDAPQLWAEAVFRYKQGERTWLSREEANVSTAEQRARLIEDAWKDDIEKIVTGNWNGYVRVEEITKALELKPKDINNVVKRRIKTALRSLGWYESKRAGEGRIWRKKEDKFDDEK